MVGTTEADVRVMSVVRNTINMIGECTIAASSRVREKKAGGTEGVLDLASSLRSSHSNDSSGRDR